MSAQPLFALPSLGEEQPDVHVIPAPRVLAMSEATIAAMMMLARGAAVSPRAPRSRPRVRILCVSANPSTEASLAVTREAESLRDRLRATTHHDAFEVVHHTGVQSCALQGLILRYKPQIVHFSGHGSRDGLIFETAHGEADAEPIGPIAKLFSILNKYVKCVVLNACFTRQQAAAIAKSVEVVVGTRGAILDSDAIAFSSAFYEALGYGEDVETAFELARNAIAIVQPPRTARRDVATPRPSDARQRRALPELFARPDVDPSRLRFARSRNK